MQSQQGSPLSTPIDDIFYSQRLEYRTVQNDPAGQEALFQLCREDSFWAGVSGRVLIPVDRQSILDIAKNLATASALYVFVYLRKGADGPSTDDDDDDDDGGDESSRKPIGMLNIGKPSVASRAPHRASELGIGIAKAYRGKGYGTEAIRWGLSWAFDYAGIHRLQLTTESWNTDAWAVYEHIGFKRDGVLREAVWFQGKWHDLYLYSILEQEWAELRKS